MTGSTPPDRAFLDSNILFSAAYRPATVLRRLCSLPDLRLLTSDYAITEAARNLPSPRQHDLHVLLRGVIVVPTPPPGTRPLPPGLVLPPKGRPDLLRRGGGRG